MRYFVFPGLVMLFCLPLCSAQSSPHSKKPEPLAILASAKLVFVEAFDGPDSPGSFRDPRVTPEDREAVENVQNALHNWGYYVMTSRRSEADVVVFVRKGRTVNADGGDHAGNGQKRDAALVTAADASANVDMLCVYSLNPQGKLSGLLWQKNLKGGLSVPKMVLLRDLKNDVINAPPLQAKEKPSLEETPFPTQ